MQRTALLYNNWLEKFYSIRVDWLKEELIDCLGILPQSAFIVTAIVCDKHPSDRSSFKKLLQDFHQDPDELFI